MGEKEDCSCCPGNPHHLFRSLCYHLQQHCRWHVPGGWGCHELTHSAAHRCPPPRKCSAKFTGASQTPGDISSQCPPAPCSTLTGPYLLQGPRALAPSEHSNPSSQPQDPLGLWVSVPRSSIGMDTYLHLQPPTTRRQHSITQQNMDDRGPRRTIL